MIALAPVVVALKPWQALAITMSLCAIAAVLVVTLVGFVAWLWLGE